jgi:flagellar basal-body rod modification protein FlgD
MATVNPFMHANPMVNGSDSNGGSNAQSSTISSNDFLTLLVTEMKNQDPTAQTDPNEYINQLVQVNSLEQLIEINQNLSTSLGTSADGEKTQVSGKKMDAVSSPDRTVIAHGSASKAGFTGTSRMNLSTADSRYGVRVAPGNLSIPEPGPAAQRVAHSLSGLK